MIPAMNCRYCSVEPPHDSEAHTDEALACACACELIVRGDHVGAALWLRASLRIYYDGALARREVGP